MSATLKGASEENVLALLCTSDQHAPRLLIEITASIFSSRTYRRIAEAAIKFITQYGRAPGAHLVDLLEDEFRRGEDGKLLERVIGDIQRLGPELQPEYVLSELDRWIDLRKVTQAAESALEAAATGNLEAAQGALHRVDIKSNNGQGIWLHDADAMLGFMAQREQDYFATGIDVLDRMGVRPNRKELLLLIGNKKVGKSWFLIQLGKMAVLSRKSVLHITLEMSQEKVARRFIQALFAMTTREVGRIRIPIFKKDSVGRMTALDFDELSPDAIGDETRSKIARKLKAFKQRAPLMIKEFASGSLTPAMLNSYLDYLARSENFVPDLLIVDYAGIMAFDVNNPRLTMGHNFLMLRQIATQRNMAVATAWQGNRETDGAKTVSSRMVAEAYKIVQDADTVLTVSRTNKERQLGLARVLVDAARDVEDKFVTMITQSYATGQFCLDSVYMSKWVDDEVKRVSGDEPDQDDE